MIKKSPGKLLVLPRKPVDRVLDPLLQFMHVQAAGGIVLAVATVTALAIANSPWGEAYLHFWETPVGMHFGSWKLEHPLLDWINDALMAIFFFVTGMEVKREIVLGELREIRRATLPLLAAVGGMIAPAVIYLSLQWGQPGQSGWGIPMATDIAFVVGCMMLLGRRVPLGLRIALLTLAIADDIGAILVIAVGYTSDLHLNWLFFGAAFLILIAFMARIGIRSILAYVLVGSIVWLCFHESGVHATIAGVILGLQTPARPLLGSNDLVRVVDWARDHLSGDWDSTNHSAAKVNLLTRATRQTISPLEYLESTLHPWVAFGILPLFALANAGVVVSVADLLHPVALAVVAGLVIGKPLGVMLMCFVSVKLGVARLPTGVTWLSLLAGGFLCGIGFTMALFIAGLAISPELLGPAKIGVLSGSVISATLGMTMLLLLPIPHDESAPLEESPMPESVATLSPPGI